MTTNTRFPLTLASTFLAVALASGCGGGGSLSANPLSPNDDSARGINGRGGGLPSSDDNGLRGDGSLDDNGGLSNSNGLEIEVEGVLETLGSDTLTVAGRSFTVAPNANIVIKQTDEPIALSDLQLGDWIDVKSYEQADGSLLAVRIRLDIDGEDGPGGQGIEVEREGRIAALTSDSVTLGGITFFVTSRTVIVDKDTEEPIAFSALQVNMRIDARGLDNGATVTANRIRVR